MRIGLLGGSFNPPHEGHVYISQLAMKRLKLDAIWWLVTPKNPFKKHIDTLDFSTRAQLCEDLITDRRIIVSDIEQKNGLRRSYDTVRHIKAHYPFTDFIWLTGMDLVAEIPRWRSWKKLHKEIALAHVIRPPTPAMIRNSRIRLLADQTHIYNPSTQSMRNIDLSAGHTYWIMDARGHASSSTQIREKLKQYYK